MIKLKSLINEDAAQDILNKLAVLYKEYQKLLAQMYGPDGTETRKAAALVKHLGNQGTFDTSRKATSPEMDKIAAENDKLRKQMGDIGSQMQDLYQQLEDVGKEDLVKKMRDYQRAQTEKYILDLADQAEKKSVEDAKANNEKLKSDQQKAIDALEKQMKQKNDQYRIDLRKWYEGPQNTPPPLPPTIGTK